MRHPLLRSLLILVFPIVPATAADELKPFPAAKHGNGELRYVEKVPVLILRGKPAEMGEQFGILGVKNAPDIQGLHERFLADAGIDPITYRAMKGMAVTLKPNFPAHHLAEIDAASRTVKRDETLFLFANTVADISSGMGCSTVIVGKDRSTTGSPLFGRNFDWQPTRGITEHTLVVVYQGEGKRAFAAVTVSPIEGVISGMNDTGLSVTINEISLAKSKDKAEFNWKGVPLLLSFRRVLEECGTVAEAEKLLRAMPRTTSCCLSVCDKDGGAVFEMTPTSLEVRGPENGVCCCTNHFRTEKLCVGKKCWRYDLLDPLTKKDVKLGVKDVFSRLDDVHQGRATLQSMVFEPGRRVLHLAYGEGPATRRDVHQMDLGKLFADK